MDRASRIDAVATGVGAGFMLLATALVLGLPQLGQVAGFFGVMPSGQSAVALVELTLWVGIGVVVTWAFIAAGMDYREVREWRRRELNRKAAEITLGALGFALLGLGLWHLTAGAVHPGSVHQALALVAQARS